MNTSCQCELAGWCERHQIKKTEHFHHLCQANAKYRRAWDDGRGPGQVNESRTPALAEHQQRAEKDRTKREIERISRSRECWRQLHEYAAIHEHDWDAGIASAWFAEWEETIPKFGCGGNCRKKWNALKLRMPPRFATTAEFYQWTIDAHNEVNRDLGKPQFVPE